MHPTLVGTVARVAGKPGVLTDPEACNITKGSVAADKNTITGSWSAAIRVTNNNNTSAMTLAGLSPTSGATATDVVNFLSASSVNSISGSTVTAAVGTAGINGGSCTFTIP